MALVAEKITKASEDKEDIYVPNPPYFKGLNEFAEGTYDCSQYRGCLYNQNDRCIYSIAPIQQQHSRACYDDIKQADIEAEHDMYD